MAIRVGILDDHRSFGEAISMALGVFEDITTVGVADSIESMVSLARLENPSVLLLDYQLGDGTGIDCASRLAAEGIEPRLILLTAHSSADVKGRALNAGFEQVLSKEAPLTEIVQAVRVRAVARPFREPSGAVRFSRRQREVLELMGQGLDPASIAEELYISVHTSRSHVKDVLRRLGASTQLSAVTKAIRQGYLLPPSKYDAHQ